MKKLFILFLIITNIYAQEDVKETPIEIILGIDSLRKLNFSPSPKIQIGNESILTYQLIPQKRELTFKGKKPGKTSVIVRDINGDIKERFLVTVTLNDQAKIVQELKDFLGDIEGIEIGIKGNRVYIGGYIVVPGDIGRVVIVLDKYPDVLRLVELSPHTKVVIANKMQDEIHKHRLKNVTVKVVNNSFWLEGIVTSKEEKQLAYDIAVAYIPDNIESLARRTESVQKIKRSPLQNFIRINSKKKPKPVPKLIKVTTQFVELTKDYNKIFGFKWQPILSQGQGSISFGRTVSGGVSTKSSNALSGTISNLFPKLSSAKAAGHAKVIYSGVLIVKDKKPASLSKKSSKPFAIGTNEFLKSEVSEAGFTLDVTPTILQKEKIDLAIKVTVSANPGDPPQTLSNNVNTSLVVTSKESAVIGGIVINKTSTDFDRNPPQGKDDFENASPLFSFIRSKSYTATRSQFVIFVTPDIIDSASSETDDIKRKFRRRIR